MRFYKAAAIATNLFYMRERSLSVKGLFNVNPAAPLCIGVSAVNLIEIVRCEFRQNRTFL